MGRRNKKGRLISGVFLLDKPLNITSNAALQVVKRLFDARKAGHTGSLDPLATGMLPICLGEATKVSAFLLDAHKKYRTTIKLGVKTSTGDAEGEVIENKPVAAIKLEKVKQLVSGFMGKIEQVPPMHSALKVNGVPLYKLARKGMVIERKSRIVEIFDIQVLALNGDELELDVHCSKGTYIRVLAEDIAEAMGTCGHVQSLRRYEVGPFREQDMISLEKLREILAQGVAQADSTLLPIEYALSDWPEVRLNDDAAYYLCQGQPVFVPRSVTHGWVRLFNGDDRFLGVGQVLDDGKVAPRKLINLNQ